MGDAIKPIAYLGPRSDRNSFAYEDQKGRLESVLRISLVAQDSPTHTENHRPMPVDQRFNGSLFPLSEISLQQFTVRQAHPVLTELRPAKMPNHPVHCIRPHRVRSPSVESTYYFSEYGDFIQESLWEFDSEKRRRQFA